MKRLLTLEDLHRFYASKGKQGYFSAKDEAHNIIVSVSGNMIFQKEDKDIEGLTPVILQACHILDNLNGSFISEDSMKAALPSFSNRPILAYIYQDDNGDYQFRDHTMHMEDDQLVYDESPVGIIPESGNAHLEYDKEKDKTYVVVDGYLFNEYSQAVDILEREGECAVSVELSIRELSYDANNDWLSIDDFFFSGITLLGKFEDGSKVLPGMAGSNIRLADFQKKSQATFSQDQVVAMLEQINNKIDQLTIEKIRKEDTLMEFETNANVTESVDETVAEEFTEVTPEATEESTEDNTIVTEALAEDTEDVTPSENEKFEAEADESEEDETDEVEEDSEDTDAEEETEDESEDHFNLKMSVTLGEKSYERFASLNSVIQGLTELVNDVYAEDGTWYSVEAYDEGTAKSRYIIMQDLWSGKGYKQAYTNKDGVLALKGEREEVTFEWLTASEKAELDSMRANYSSIESELAKYKAEPEKMAVLESEDYKNLEGTEAFESLKAQDAHFDLSVDEVKAKCDEMLLEFAKGHKVEPVNVEDTTDEVKTPVTFKRLIPSSPAKTGKYGGVFSRNRAE